MNSVLEMIVRLLDVERIEENMYQGQNHATEHVFGGQVLAQAIAAAFRTVRPEHQLHSVHGYFLRAGDWNIPILYEVDRIRDGRSFSTRRVVAIQHGRAIFHLSSSWQKREEGLQHGAPMPDVPPPEPLRGERAMYAALAESHTEYRRYAYRFEAIDSRHVERISVTDDVRHPPYRHTWMKVRDPLPDDTEVHLALLAYMSDMDFMSTSMLPHGRNTMRDQVRGASLDHALWFHRPCRADEWLLFVKESPNASGARGFVRGRFYNRGGDLVVTAAQECLIRPVGKRATAS
ncbi:MAG: acyl-CoA thioesterase II [Pseudomonadales bacterium]|jgi:acyl-CoA thioesterase-2|nr:acyl-CoA thioesterase II [Pseudomonadales bacterium]MDP6470511.1 acyl-CoA thioesterase II [Pseudomonadales bacterium]MDP6827813.1 acyl-CoA thioesterase II [Pseudomonadales bacterium]MDP6972985.1 acyl-CoA thioesterase II [Pseudomonadales bacterium]